MASEVEKKFIEGIGLPVEREETGIEFTGMIDQMDWDDFQKSFGSGYYLNGFLYLFGKELSKLKPCIDYWHTFLEDDETYTPVGVNKHGAILLAVNFEEGGFASNIIMLDPFSASVWKNPNVVFMNMIGNYLPTKDLSGFTDDTYFKDYLKEKNEDLDFLDILAIKVPLTLGGKIEASNFQIENIVEYYKSTGEIYSNYNNDEEA